MTRADGARGTIPTMNMSDSEKPNTSPATPCNWLNQAGDFARREPTKAVVSAFGAGFLINLLPIGAILGALAAVAFALARPVLIVFGLLKLWDLCPCKKQPKV